jgi:hypothetical protein
MGGGGTSILWVDKRVFGPFFGEERFYWRRHCKYWILVLGGNGGDDDGSGIEMYCTVLYIPEICLRSRDSASRLEIGERSRAAGIDISGDLRERQVCG